MEQMLCDSLWRSLPACADKHETMVIPAESQTPCWAPDNPPLIILSWQQHWTRHLEKSNQKLQSLPQHNVLFKSPHISLSVTFFLLSFFIFPVPIRVRHCGLSAPSISNTCMSLVIKYKKLFSFFNLVHLPVSSILSMLFPENAASFPPNIYSKLLSRTIYTK